MPAHESYAWIVDALLVVNWSVLSDILVSTDCHDIFHYAFLQY